MCRSVPLVEMRSLCSLRWESHCRLVSIFFLSLKSITIKNSWGFTGYVVLVIVFFLKKKGWISGLFGVKWFLGREDERR